jgi:hypothetical protein
LVAETIYEVERVCPHRFGIGFAGVKLVGIETIFKRTSFEKVKN